MQIAKSRIVIHCPDQATWDYVNQKLVDEPVIQARWNYNREHSCMAINYREGRPTWASYSEIRFYRDNGERIYTLQEYLIMKTGIGVPGQIVDHYSIF